MSYRPRIVDQELRDQLAASGAVLIEGPKACGKTETARQAARSEVLLDLDGPARASGLLDPSLLLEGDTPRLLDEWQLVPALWNQVRRTVDARRTPGQFVLTGSAVPADDVTRHSGAGRITRVRMRPMSTWEAGRSTGDVSLNALFSGQGARAADSGLTVVDLADLVVRGGWPLHLGASTKAAMHQLTGYLRDVERTDVQRVDGVRRDPVKVQRLLRAYARHVATEASLSTIAADVGGDAPDSAAESAHRQTITDYLVALERLMVVEEQPAWAPHLRSRARIRSASKRHFVDPSLATAALGAAPDRLLADPAFFGTLFESMVVRDLRVYAQAADASVLHYRDNTGLEVDAIVERRDGAWAAFEVKLGVGAIDDAAATLLRFRAKVDAARSGPPAALAVIVGTGFGYRRPDGVDVIPIGALGP